MNPYYAARFFGGGFFKLTEPWTARGEGKKLFEDDDELWQYIEALKGEVKDEIEEQKQEVVEALSEAEPARAEVPIALEPLDGLYADLDDLIASTASLEQKWAEVRRIEREYREQKLEEEAVFRLLMEL